MAHNVGTLKKLIENLPDDMPLVTSSFDHQYRRVSAGTVEAEPQCGNYWFEYDKDFSDEDVNPQTVLVFN